MKLFTLLSAIFSGDVVGIRTTSETDGGHRQTSIRCHKRGPKQKATRQWAANSSLIQLASIATNQPQ